MERAGRVVSNPFSAGANCRLPSGPRDSAISQSFRHREREREGKAKGRANGRDECIFADNILYSRCARYAARRHRRRMPTASRRNPRLFIRPSQPHVLRIVRVYRSTIRPAVTIHAGEHIHSSANMTERATFARDGKRPRGPREGRNTSMRVVVPPNTISSENDKEAPPPAA